MAKKHRKLAKNIENTPVSVLNTPRNRLSSTDFNPDYTDIKKDLKRIGILAVSFVGVLIILTFFLR
ncbi:MAG TPA: hypothetical protein VK856_15970 [Anaerolineaceae bacterium]|nr:hypothetical protein [Anaerolineaceae bacterium]